MHVYEHSVMLDDSKCTGCTTCLRHCPTEAIRIIDKKAVIDSDRCVDCGECIRVCPQKAKKAVVDKLDDIKKYKWSVALPAPTLYGQFENLDSADYVLDGLIKLGFNDVYEVAKAAELVTAYTRVYLNTGVTKPAISSACPVVLRLISLRFPSLKDHVIHMLPPMEIAAKLAKEKALEEHPEFSPEEIGVFFITPCPAKASYIKNGFAGYKSAVDGVISISDIYFSLISVMSKDGAVEGLSEAGKIGIGWARSGGEATSIFNDNYLAADGIDNIIHVLDQVETGNIPQLDFIELNACSGGCVGGVLTIQNPFIAKARLLTLRRYLPISPSSVSLDNSYIPDGYLFEDMPEYRPASRLGSTIAESMRMMADIQRIKSDLPGIDCGSCGAPNCRAFAEDVVSKGRAVSECPILYYLNNTGKE